MQVTLNGKASDGLKPRVDKELTPGRRLDRIEGAVITADQATSTATRRMRLLYGFLVGLVTVIIVPVLVGAALYEPRDFVFLGPLALVLGIGLAAFMRFMYRRNALKLRHRADEQAPRMAAAGAVVLVEASGLGIGANRYAWSALTATALDITVAGGGDSDSVTLIERLELDGGGLPIVLDALLISNGHAVVQQAWRRLQDANGGQVKS